MKTFVLFLVLLPCFAHSQSLPSIPFAYEVSYSSYSSLLKEATLKQGVLHMDKNSFALIFSNPASIILMTPKEYKIIEFSSPKNKVTLFKSKPKNMILEFFNSYNKAKTISKTKDKEYFIIAKKIKEYEVKFYFKDNNLKLISYFDNVDSALTIELDKKIDFDKSKLNYISDPKKDDIFQF